MSETEIDNSPSSWDIISAMLRQLPIGGISMLSQLTGSIRASGESSQFYGDEEHTIYLLAGFLTVESAKHAFDARMKEIAVEKRYFLIREERRLLLQGRFMPRDRKGSVSFGLVIRRIGEDRFHVSNVSM